MVVLVLATFWFDRDFLSGIYCTLAALLLVLVALRILAFDDAFDTVLRGFTSMVEPLVTPDLLPVAIFISMALASFVTGSNWGIFVIVMPIVATLTRNLGSDPALVIGATISASTFGSHACFDSDTTDLTDKATGCTPLQYALTQFPYALIAALAAVLGYLLLAWV